jgi:hypothetical protein
MLKGLLGLPPNTREGITWLKRAAENADEENPQALHVLVNPSVYASHIGLIIRTTRRDP